MNSNRYTPESIVESKVRFFIPLYQRLFAWSAADVQCLLDDLSHHFSGSEQGTPYYLGVITTIYDKSIGKKILVDGQQRLTVLMLCAAVFMKHSDEWKKFFDEGKRLELFARKEDSEYLVQLSQGKKSGKYVNILMKSAYDTIEKFTEELSENVRSIFIANAFQKTTLFNSVLPESYLKNPESLNRYFEVMNSAGVSLEQHEVLKVMLLREQPEQRLLLRIWNLCSDFSRPLLRQQENVSLENYRARYQTLFDELRRKRDADHIVGFILKYNSTDTEAEGEGSFATIAEIPAKRHKFDNRFGNDEERSILSFSEFLLLALAIFKKQDGGWTFHKADKLIERFSELLPPEEIPAFYLEMLLLRIVLDYFIIRRRTAEGSDSDYSLLYSDGKTESRCLMQYEAMLYVSTPVYEWIKPLYEHVLSTDRPTAESILNLLKGWDNRKHGSVPDLHRLHYPEIDRYWFWRLDYYLWEETFSDPKEENAEDIPMTDDCIRAIKSYQFKTNRSIEHLHPQDQSKNDAWPAEQIDSFGNLAMISQSFNSQQSNDDVHVKFSRLETHIKNQNLQSLKLLFMYLDAKKNPDEWTPDICAAHEDRMISILKVSFRSDERS